LQQPRPCAASKAKLGDAGYLHRPASAGEESLMAGMLTTGWAKTT
jgi:hypothetical protein